MVVFGIWGFNTATATVLKLCLSDFVVAILVDNPITTNQQIGKVADLHQGIQIIPQTYLEKTIEILIPKLRPTKT